MGHSSRASHASLGERGSVISSPVCLSVIAPAFAVASAVMLRVSRSNVSSDPIVT